MHTRAGRCVKQLTGYRAFIPAPLPPDPPVAFDAEMMRLLSDADRALGRLDGVSTILPDPNLFVAMYVRHEAVLSSQIEGTQSTLGDILTYEVDHGRPEVPRDAEEVVNYVHAMNYGLDRLGSLPLSLRLIREIHQRLLAGVRGNEREPGEFRRSQNWIGPGGCSLSQAEFVPPPPHEMMAALDNFEKFLHDRRSLPALVQCGLAHAQFETIHPFLDGNGRVGRLLVTLLLCERDILRLPLLYLSYYLKAHRSEYYDRLTAIRVDGNWEGWLKFFLTGIHQVSLAATETARAILALRERDHGRVAGQAGGIGNALRLLDVLFRRPVLDVRTAEQLLGCRYKAASTAIGQLERLGIVKEITGQQRNRIFRYDEYVALFDQQALQLPNDIGEPKVTASLLAPPTSD